MNDGSYRFGIYRVNPALRELWRGDDLVSLPPHVFDCLTYLLLRHDRAVGRDELVSAVWGKTEISDTLLGQTILRIRRELGDDAKQQHILRTIPRFGYRWVAALEVDEMGDAPSADGPADAAAATRQDSPNAQLETSQIAISPPRAALPAKPRWRLPIVAAVVAATIILLVAIQVLRTRTSKPIPATAALSAENGLTSAVLPANVAPGTEWAWMRLGVMDIVAGQLRSSGLPSVPSEDVVTLLNAPAATRGSNLRQTLAAQLLVKPHVQQRDDGPWEVALVADGGTQHYSVTAHSRDVTAAAREAANKLLVAIGRLPAQTTAESAPDVILIKRIDAAVLADDAEGARKLIAQATDEQKQSPQLRLRLAKIDFRAGKLDAAQKRLHGLLDEAPAQTAPVLRGSVLNGLGAVAIRSNKPREGVQLFTQAIDMLEVGKDPAQLGQAYLGRAASAAELGDADAAVADYARARIALRQANDTLALIRVTADEGFLDMDRGRPALALPQLISAAQGFEQWGALNETLFAYIGQINCYLELLDNVTAMQVADKANALAQRVANPSTLNSFALARAKALAAAGRIREARSSLENLRGPGANPVTAAMAGLVLAPLDLDANQTTAAAALADQATLVLDAPNNVTARAKAWLVRIRVELRLGDVAGAANTLGAFDAWADKTNNPRALLYARLADAEYAASRGDAGQWRHAFDVAGALAQQGAIPLEIAAVANSYADALLRAGDYAAAEVEVGRVSRWSGQDFNSAVLEARLYAALGRNEARQTAVARAHVLAGERRIPADALEIRISGQVRH